MTEQLRGRAVRPHTAGQSPIGQNCVGCGEANVTLPHECPGLGSPMTEHPTDAIQQDGGFFYVEWIGKPCPFCGADGVSGKSPTGHFFAGCPDADCMAHNLAYDFVTVDHARAAWNTRMEAAKPSTPIDGPSDATKRMAKIMGAEFVPNGQGAAIDDEGLVEKVARAIKPDAWEPVDGYGSDLIKHQVNRSNSLRYARAAIEVIRASNVS